MMHKNIVGGIQLLIAMILYLFFLLLGIAIFLNSVSDGAYEIPRFLVDHMYLFDRFNYARDSDYYADGLPLAVSLGLSLSFCLAGLIVYFTKPNDGMILIEEGSTSEKIFSSAFFSLVVLFGIDAFVLILGLLINAI